MQQKKEGILRYDVGVDANNYYPVSVDGGKDYLRRCGNREDWEDMSVWEEEDI